MPVTLGTLRIGSARSHSHDLEEINANFHPGHVAEEAYGFVNFRTTRPEKCVKLWLTPAGLVELLTRVIGALPIGVLDNPKLQQLCRMITSGKERTQYVVQTSFDYLEEEGRTWASVWGMYEKKTMALAAINNHMKSGNAERGTVYRLVERRE